jgi:trehalose/maltose hydrolase-like predicted phosphorylase
MDNWIIQYEGWKPEEHPLREALCTLGNGYFATRGAVEEVARNQYNYPGTYLAGGYNRVTSKVEGEKVENEDLVNWPNWLFLTFKHRDGEWFNLADVEIREYIQNLNLKTGILERKMRFTDRSGKETSLISRRMVSMDDQHVAGIEWTLIPENWEGDIIIRSGIDGGVTNNGVERYRKFNGKHHDISGKGWMENEECFLAITSNQSLVRMVQGVKTSILINERKQDYYSQRISEADFVGHDMVFACEKLQPIRIEKLAVIYTSKDFAISDPLTEAQSKLRRLTSFSHLLTKHVAAWQQIWERNDIEIESVDSEQLILRLHIFHLNQTVSKNSIDMDVGVPSRGWHGEAYRGHIFWDELYIFPYLNLHAPHIARSSLMYRYRRLDEARQIARENGYKGALFPWQSGSNGREESQKIHLNPVSGRWIPDYSWLQRHINAAIPYNVWQYYQATNDKEFLIFYGAEIILDTALFWSSIAEFNPKLDRYEIRGVMGPDEYHTQYPGTDSHGLNNNAYTNFMTVWVIQCALNLFEMLDPKHWIELSGRINLLEEDIEKWKVIAHRMYIPFHEGDIISQFEGYDELVELDWKKYQAQYGEIMRLDRILEMENDSPNRYKASKQADVLMLFYLFSSDEIVKQFRQLGYDFKKRSIIKNITYYQKRTSHGSTLSQVIHSWVYARSDRNRSWKTFEKALMSDFKDVQGGTTPEGIHLGAMAGTVDLIQRCYTGLEIHDDVLWLNPRLPNDIKSISLHVRYRSHWIKLDISHSKLKIDFDRGWAEPVEIAVKDQKITFSTNDTKEFDLLE